MKLMVVGSDKIFAIENFYVKYIREAGIEVEAFNAQSVFYDYYQANILNKLIFKAGFSGILKKINLLFREALEKFNPDAIWVFKGMEIFPSSLQWAKSKGIKLVNYNPDNPFLFTGKGSGNENITQSIPLYDLHFTYNREIQDQLDRQFKIKTAYLPFGFDVSPELLSECAAQQETVKACFLGNPDKQRAAFILELAEKGAKIDLYGNDWNKFIQHDNIVHCAPVYGNDLWKVLRRYRIQLNIMRIHNEDSHNMRTFEVPGIGGIQTAPDTTEHRKFFEDGKEIFLYRNSDECVKKIQFLLQLGKEQADEIRTRARMRSIESGYSYKDRALFALREIQRMNE